MNLISRKRFLVGAAALTGGAVTASVFAGEASAAALPVYVLDPEWGAGTGCSGAEGTKSRGCHGCRACHLHSSNTLFATAEDADLYRAHPGCKCVVTEGPVLPHDTWVALFGLPNAIARSRVDRRTPWVADVLAAIVTTTTTTNSTPGQPSGTPLEAPTNARVSAAGGQLQVLRFRVGRMGRDVLIDLDLSAPATVQARFSMLNDRPLVKRHYAVQEGPSQVRFRVPSGVRPGRYRVQVVLRSSQGQRRMLSSPFVVYSSST